MAYSTLGSPQKQTNHGTNDQHNSASPRRHDRKPLRTFTGRVPEAWKRHSWIGAACTAAFDHMDDLGVGVVSVVRMFLPVYQVETLPIRVPRSHVNVLDDQ
jgi:hypothetical protein